MSVESYIMSTTGKNDPRFQDLYLFHGKSAYQAAVEQGFTGTEMEWIASLMTVEFNVHDQFQYKNQWLLYVATDYNHIYRYDPNSNKYIQIGVPLGETELTAYRGDRGKAAYDHSLTDHDFLNRKGGIMVGDIQSMNIAPKANNTYDLGSTSYRYKNIYGVTGNFTTVKATNGNFTNISGELSGNATSASKIQTGQNLTIGLTAKKVDLSGPVSWSLTEIGAVPLAGTDAMTGAIRNITGTYNATAGSRYNTSALVVRENNFVGPAQSDIAYAPSIGFHWAGRVAGTLVLRSDAVFAFLNQAGGYGTLHVGHLESSTVNATTFTGALNGNASSASRVLDAGNNTQIALNYSASGLTTTSWFAVWNNYELRAMSPDNVRATIGASHTSHTHTYIRPYNDYSFDATTLPNSFELGVTCGFVNQNSGFGSYGSVLTVRPFNGGGGSLQLYAPYSSNFGGTHLKARFGNYGANSGNSWTALKDIAWVEDIPTKYAGSASAGGDATNALKLQGYQVSTNANANTIALRDGNGYLYAVYYNASCGVEHASSYASTGAYIMFADSGGWLRKSTVAGVQSLLGLGSAAYTNTSAYATAGHNHDSIYLKLSGGSMTGRIGGLRGTYNSAANSRYATSALEIRENDAVGSAQSDIAYAPSIGFHWANRCAATIALAYTSVFCFINQSGGNAAIQCGAISSNGNWSTSGTITGSKVYNAVWNDYAEWYERENLDEKFEPGDIVSWNDTGVIKSVYSYDNRVVGVYSDTYGHIVGGEALDNMEDNIKKFVPVGIGGRCEVKVIGEVRRGDLIVSSGTPGVGMAIPYPTIDAMGCIIGKALEDKKYNHIGKVKIQIMLG